MTEVMAQSFTEAAKRGRAPDPACFFLSPRQEPVQGVLLCNGGPARFADPA